MITKKIGQQTVYFYTRPAITSWASVVGPREGEGPLKEFYDLILQDNIGGEKSWEKAEQKMMQHSIEIALEKAKEVPSNLDFYLAGDLLNQIVCANFTARFLGVPFFGLYGACSTMAEGLCLAAILLDGGFAQKVGASASSHHDSAEKQLRYPTELGVQRPPTAQWTVTGAGSVLMEAKKSGIAITHATIGKIVDMGISNTSDMGTAMAPAAFSTLKAHLNDLGRKIEDYDLIMTGDLGYLGVNALKNLMLDEGYSVENLVDCGTLVYHSGQDTHSGGSGCGCSAIVLCGYILEKLKAGKYNRIFLMGTGALLSPVTSFQGETIPGIAHGIVLEKQSEV